MKDFVLIAIERFPQLLWVVLPPSLLIVAILSWLKFRKDRLHLTKESTQAFIGITKDEPLGTQLAASHAFGVVIDNRVIEEARRRDNPLGLLNRFKKARSYLRTYEDGSFRPFKDTDFKKRAFVLHIFVTAMLALPWFLLFVLDFVEPSKSVTVIKALSATFGSAALVFAFPLLSLATANEEAHRLTNELDVHHPLRGAD